MHRLSAEKVIARIWSRRPWSVGDPPAVLQLQDLDAALGIPLVNARLGQGEPTTSRIEAQTGQIIIVLNLQEALARGWVPDPDVESAPGRQPLPIRGEVDRLDIDARSKASGAGLECHEVPDDHRAGLVSGGEDPGRHSFRARPVRQTGSRPNARQVIGARPVSRGCLSSGLASGRDQTSAMPRRLPAASSGRRERSREPASPCAGFGQLSCRSRLPDEQLRRALELRCLRGLRRTTYFVGRASNSGMMSARRAATAARCLPSRLAEGKSQTVGSASNGDANRWTTR